MERPTFEELKAIYKSLTPDQRRKLEAQRISGRVISDRLMYPMYKISWTA